MTTNMELIDLRKIIYLRDFEVSVEKYSVCKFLEKIAEHDIDCLPWFYTNDVIYLLPQQLRRQFNTKAPPSRRHSAKV